MEFLGIFMPFAILVDIAWVALYIRDRRLVRLIRARHPDVFDALRGRPRRWYDPSDEVWIQQAAVRRKLRRLLAVPASSDAQLAAALERIDAGERSLRTAAWVGAALTALFALSLVAWLH